MSVISSLIPSLVTQIGMGGIFGFVVGFAIKKMAKIIIMILGLFFAVLIYLSYTEYIIVNYEKIVSSFEKAFQDFISGATSASTFLSINLPLVGAIALGFLIGFKAG